MNQLTAAVEEKEGEKKRKKKSRLNCTGLIPCRCPFLKCISDVLTWIELKVGV